MRIHVRNMQARMNDMSLSLAALSADKSDLEERLAKEEVHKKKTQMHMLST